MSDVEELMISGAVKVVRAEMLEHEAKTAIERAQHRGVAHGARMMMMDVLIQYWGERRELEVHYATIRNAVHDRRIKEWNRLYQEGLLLSRQNSADTYIQGTK